MISTNNLIDVSKQQRIVFVDNITNDNAKTLSEQYPFGVFMGNDTTNKTGLIYKNGTRYSLITGVDKSLHRIGLYNIGLVVDENGVLKLNVVGAIQEFYLYQYQSNGTFHKYHDGDTITIYDNADLYFVLKDENGNQLSYPQDDILYFNDGPITEGYINIPIISGYTSDIYNQFETEGASDDVDEFLGIKYHIIANKDTYGNNIQLTTSLLDLEPQSYNINIILSQDNIFYIGEISNDIMNYINSGSTDYIVYTKDINSNLNETGWHNFNATNIGSAANIYSYYETYPFTITDIDNFVLILPENMVPQVELKENGKNIPDFIDNNFNGSFNKYTDLTVNNKLYIIYKFKNNEENPNTQSLFNNYLGFKS